MSKFYNNLIIILLSYIKNYLNDIENDKIQTDTKIPYALIEHGLPDSNEAIFAGFIFFNYIVLQGAAGSCAHRELLCLRLCFGLLSQFGSILNEVFF